MQYNGSGSIEIIFPVDSTSCSGSIQLDIINSSARDFPPFQVDIFPIADSSLQTVIRLSLLETKSEDGVSGVLGGSITRSLQQMSSATIIDEKALNECLNEIARALLQSDVQFKLVRDMQANIKKIVNLDDLAAGHNTSERSSGRPYLMSFAKCWILESHLLRLKRESKVLSCSSVCKALERQLHVQSTHTTIRKRDGNQPWFCADTFRAGAFDRLKQNATKAKIPFYRRWVVFSC